MERKPRLLPEESNNNEEWKKVLTGVDVNEIPINLLKYLKTHMKNGNSFVFPVKEWLDSGASEDEVEESIYRWIEIKNKEIESSDFVIDLEKLEETVSPHTQQMLKNLK